MFLETWKTRKDTIYSSWHSLAKKPVWYVVLVFFVVCFTFFEKLMTQHINESFTIHPRKFTLEAENDGYQKEFPLPRGSFSGSISVVSTFCVE